MVGGASGAIEGNLWQIWVQFEGVVVVAVWSGVASLVILYAMKPLMTLRVSEDEEMEGLDSSQHGRRSAGSPERRLRVSNGSPE